MSNKFVAVKKFVKNSIKKLKSIEKYYPKNEGSNFWVVEIDKENVENQSQSNGKILIGCVGFKRTRTSLEFFPLESVEKNLKSPNDFQESSYPRAGVKDRGEVTHLCVDSLYRRKGMGKILMDVMINWAKECSSNMVTDNKLIECEIQNTPGRLNEISVGVSVDEVGRIPFGSGGKEIECKESTISLNSIDLTVLTELIPAIELYEQLGFKIEDQPVDLGGGCYLQHMTMRI